MAWAAQVLIELATGHGGRRMVFKYNLEFDATAVAKNIERLTNQIFKLLPSREEGEDWETPLQNLILEVIGMKALWIDQIKLFSLLCRLEALLSLTEDEFLAFRKLIFECLRITNEIKEECLIAMKE
jgi:hypothetical protein